jgi:hypothetical protein
VFNYGDSFKDLAKELEKEFIKYGMIKEENLFKFKEKDDGDENV